MNYKTLTLWSIKEKHNEVFVKVLNNLSLSDKWDLLHWLTFTDDNYYLNYILSGKTLRNHIKKVSNRTKINSWGLQQVEYYEKNCL